MSTFDEIACDRLGPNNGRGTCTAGLSIRRATACDLEPLSFFFDTVLRRDYFLRRGQLADILGSARHRVFVVEIDRVLVGIAIVTRGRRLINVLVHPSYRGLGIGSLLVDRSGAVEVRAKIDMSTGDPRGFYRRLGFETNPEHEPAGNIESMRKADRAAS